MAAFKSGFNPTATPQSKPIPGRAQVKNRAGGYVFEIDKWEALRRFLTIGTMGGTYYASEAELTEEHYLGLLECIKDDGLEVLRQIDKVSTEGLALKNDYALYALAVVSVNGDTGLRKSAFQMLSKVARTGTHLFQFVAYREAVGGGWGELMRRTIRDFYLKTPIAKLAYQVTKYQARDGWSHRDLLRLAHPRPQPAPGSIEGGENTVRQNLLRWIMDGVKGYEGQAGGKHPPVEARPAPPLDALPEIVDGFEQAKLATSEAEVVGLIERYQLTREMVPTQFLDKPTVQEALLQKQPLHAMIRNLGNLTKSGLLTPSSAATKLVIAKLTDGEQLKRSRVHPFAVLIALHTYKTGHGKRGKGTWVPVPRVIDALDDAFYGTLDAMKPSGKNLLIGVDISGSMTAPAGDTGMSALECGAAMAFITIRAEQSVRVVAFQTNAFVVGVSPKQRLDDAIRTFKELPSGGTDCNLPMFVARSQNWNDLDAFALYTDNETWAGWQHPSQGLAAYRKHSGRATKFVEVAMTATKHGIADRKDPLCLGVSGFSADAAKVIGEFVGS